MRKTAIFFILAIMTFIPKVLSAQGTSSKSSVVKFNLQEAIGVYMPPELYVDIDFQDKNDNKILEAGETGILNLAITNKGGIAEGVKIHVSPETSFPELVFEQNEVTVDVMNNSKAEISIPILATERVATDSVKIKIEIKEPMGYDITALMLLSTFEAQRPRIKLQGVSIVDAGKNLRYNGSPDGKLQKGEVVNAILTVQNVGQAPAHKLSYKVESKNPNVILMNDAGVVPSLTGTMEELKIGETQEVVIRISVNNKYEDESRYLPLYITVTEDKHSGDLISEAIPISLGITPAKTTIVKVEPDVEKLMAMRKSEVFSTSDRISSRMKIRDISVAPLGEALFPDAIAVVIGAQDNKYNVAPAPYAARDAEIMSTFFKNSLGIKDVRLYTNEEVTGSRLSDLFDPNGDLHRSIIPGQTDIFVFYSGHGMPDESAENDGKQDIYLFPYDGRKDMLSTRCYSLNNLYKNLNSMNAHSVTVILDACFSGSTRQSGTFAGISIGNTKGISIQMKDLSHTPWMENQSFRVITSSSGSQTSLGLDQSQSGLFTYFLAVGLQGEADSDKNGEITLRELMEYISTNVSTTARQIRNGDQTPMLYGDDNLIIEKLK